MDVFVVEQRVPPEEEMDELDAEAIHVLAFLDGEPGGTGRLLLGEDGTARIGRMAVLEPYRYRGVGSAILLKLMDIARERGVRNVTLAGQLHAIPFYERFGFELTGRLALLTAPLHWAIFAFGAWAFFSNRSWAVWWAAMYAFIVAVSHLVWSEVSPNGRGWPIGLAQAAAFSVLGGVLLRVAARADHAG